jgi:Tol biopolymer transport system component
MEIAVAPLMQRLAFIAICLLGANPAAAACIPNPTNEPYSTFPQLTGKLVYHSYRSYGDGTGQIFLLDFKNPASLKQLSASGWNIRDPINPMLSPDGNWITFMGVRNNAWNVFLYRLDGTVGPVDLTGSSGATRNEDPKFSADGTKLVFKQNRDVKLAPIIFTNGVPSLGAVQNLTQTAPVTENSMPFLSPDSTRVYFATGASSNSAILYKPVAGGAASVFERNMWLATYYPIVRSDGSVFYSRWKDVFSRLDQIYVKTTPMSPAVQLLFNDCNGNNSDAAPVDGTNYVFFSSTTQGGYQLYLGDAGSGKRWSLSQFNVNSDTTTAKLGSHYR